MLSSSIKQVFAALREGKIQASELCEQCLARARKFKDLNFVVTETTDLARKQAGEADRRYRKKSALGPLDGIPVAVKDNFSTRSIQTSCASRMLIGYKPPYTATVVQKLFDGGAVLTSKTNLDEFAMGSGTVDSVWGPVKNPWTYTSAHQGHLSDTRKPTPGEATDDWHVAGGSSGGSAAAVATGAVLGSLGSDTGGSVRIPASYCGVVGLKPTYGRLSRHGLIPLVNALDVPGIFGGTVDDVAIILNTLSGHDPLDSTSLTNGIRPVHLPEEPSVEGLCVGIPEEYHAPGLSNDVVDLWRRAADALDDAGAQVCRVSMPHTRYSIVCYHVLSVCEIASNMARYDGLKYGHRAADDTSTEALYAATRREGFNDVVRGRILAGNYFILRENYDHYFAKAQKVWRLIKQDFEEVFSSGVDVLLMPTTLSDAPTYHSFTQASNRRQSEEQDVFTQPANLAGVPAVSIPAGLSRHGLPIGLQLMAPPLAEQTLLTAASWLQRKMACPGLSLDWLDHDN